MYLSAMLTSVLLSPTREFVLWATVARLGHVHRASRMRTAIRSSSAEKSSPSKISRKGADNAEDNEEEPLKPKTWSVQESHHFTKQDNFIPFDADD